MKAAPHLERRIPYLTLYWPATASITLYRLDASGLHLLRRLHGVQPSPCDGRTDDVDGADTAPPRKAQ